MGKILYFNKKKKSSKKNSSYLEYMQGIINGFKTNKLILFPLNRRKGKNHGKNRP